MSHSAIYRGEVMHHRFRPTRHRFIYKVDSFLFNLDSLQEEASQLRWFSVDRFNLFSFYHRDFGNSDGTTGRQYIEGVLTEQGCDQHPARIELLCYPRILGYTFNPLSVYYCYSSSDDLFAVLYEVSNTFGQRHSYFLPVKTEQQQADYLRQACDKVFYVSPFIPMEARYHFRLRRPDEQLLLAIRETENQQALLHAVFRGERQPLSDRSLLGSFCRLPMMTLRIVLAIHWQAAKLFIKGLRILPRPDEPERRISRTEQ